MKICAAVALVSIVSAGGPAFAASTADEIRAALVGNTFQGGMGGADYTSFFGADGTYKDKDGTGQYTVDDKGVCYPGTDFGCYQATSTAINSNGQKTARSKAAEQSSRAMRSSSR